MLLNCILLVLGLALVVIGADALVDGASSVARRFHLSEFIIGLTIVGMGTSAPEMVVSLVGAIEGKGDVSVGNIVGSNVFNTMLILGITAILLPIGITGGNRKRDIPVNIVVTLLFILMGLKGTLFGLGTDGLSRIDGAVLLAVFALYMWLSVAKDRKNAGAGEEERPAGDKPAYASVLLILGGLGGLILGGRLFVNNATDIARALGVSDKFIAVTVLACGTSLPELATCIAAAVRKKGQLALGNIIGSNIFNILLILGASALIRPIAFVDINLVDMGALLLSALALAAGVFIGDKNKIGRIEGAFFVLIWISYMIYLFMSI